MSTIDILDIPKNLKPTEASRAILEHLDVQCRITLAMGQGKVELGQILRRLANWLAWLEADKIYYKGEELLKGSILRKQLFLKSRLLRDVADFEMPYLEIVTLKGLMTHMKEENIEDF